MKKILFLTLALTLLFAGCSKDDNEPNITLPVTLTLQTNEVISRMDIPYHSGITSSDDFVIKVSDGGDGSTLFTPQHVGKAEIRYENQVCRVTITPSVTLYPDPYTDWGASKAAIKANAGTPYSESATSLLYQLSSTTVIGYMFENDKLKGVGVTVSTTQTRALSRFLLERYKIVTAGTGDIAAMYCNANSIQAATVIVGVQLTNSSVWTVLYSSNTL